MVGVSKVHFVGTPYASEKFPRFHAHGAENIKGFQMCANLSEHAQRLCLNIFNQLNLLCYNVCSFIFQITYALFHTFSGQTKKLKFP